MRSDRDIHKMAVYSIVINVIQIVTVIAMCVMIFFERDLHISPLLLRLLLLVSMVVVSYGAVMDIREARSAMRTNRQANMLREAYTQLETLNHTLRAQRHDFMNHLQVVYGLIEMEEHQEAADYIEKVYDDIQAVNHILRTKNPAVNALLQVKLAECERRGIAVRLEIRSPWEELVMPGWEMCRVLGNLIDNAMDALGETQNPWLRVSISEDVRKYGFSIENNGPEISDETLERLFAPGFTTKTTGQGMGLFIVDTLIRRYGGQIEVDSSPEVTVFRASLPRPLENIKGEAGIPFESEEKKTETLR